MTIAGALVISLGTTLVFPTFAAAQPLTTAPVAPRDGQPLAPPSAVSMAPPIPNEDTGARGVPLPPPAGWGPMPFPAPGYAANTAWGPNPFPINEDDFGDESAERHRGFWLRLVSGPVYSSLSAQRTTSEATLGGWGAGVAVAAGGALSENFVLYGEVEGASALNPHVQIPSADGAGHLGTALTTLGLGGGLAYYLMPANISVSGTIMLAQARAVERSSQRLLGRTSWGPAIAATAGKEWWLSDYVGLGIALRAHVGSLADAGGSGVAWRTVGLSAALSLSFQGG